jgi:hypothetical protein
MQEHKQKELDGEHEDWCVQPIEVLP